MPPFINRKRTESSEPEEPPPKKKKTTAAPVPPPPKPIVKGGKKENKKKKKPKVQAVATIAEKKPSLFDAIDRSRGSSKVADSELLANFGGSDDDDLSSDPDSDDFEDVAHGAGPSTEIDGEDSDEEEDDWEDAVPIPEEQERPDIAAAGDLELNLGGPQGKDISYAEMSSGKKQGPSKRDKQIRVLAHCMHVQFLMWHNHVRNHWLNDKEVQKIMVDHVNQSQKLKVQFQSWKQKSGIDISKPQPTLLTGRAGSKSTGTGNGKGKAAPADRGDPRAERDWGRPAERQAVGQPDMSRGDPLQHFLNVLASWWKQRFTITAPGLRKHGYKSVKELRDEVRSWREGESDVRDHGERVADLKEFRSHARCCEGSRDVGAQLFVALLRGLGIDSRMVSSLQPLGFGFTKVETAASRPKHPAAPDAAPPSKKSKPNNTKAKRKQKATGSKADAIALSDTSDLSELPGAGQEDDVSDASIIDITPKKRPNMPYDRDLLVPNYWIEAVSSLTHRVFPVDPFLLQTSVATNADHLMLYEPRGAKADKARQVIAYVIAHSADNTAKDVTVRYIRKHVFPGKTKGFRLPSAKIAVRNRQGKVRGYYEVDWWQTVLSSYTRPAAKRTIADDIEDQGDLKPMQPEKKAPKEGVPDTLDGFKRSAEYVLARHLRREEALLPGAEAVSTFKTGKGAKEIEEDVYLRKDLAVTKTAESWHKEGRKVKVGQQPLKKVPFRAVTTTRKREIEEMERETGEKAMQGMYSRDQTEWIIPPPIRDGVIPKNGYGNMDAFVPQMIPKGAIHIPLRGTVRICKKLEIDFAEAVTGFEFGNRMAVPVIEGVVVAEENRERVMDAWQKADEERQAREAVKQQKLVLSTWRKFLMGLRIMEKMREEYDFDAAEGHERETVNPFTNPKLQSQPGKSSGLAKGAKGAKAASSHVPTARPVSEVQDDSDMGGGFLADDSDMGGGFIPEGRDVELVVNGRATQAVEPGHDFHLEQEEDFPDGTGAKLKRPMRSMAELAAEHVIADEPQAEDQDEEANEEDGSSDLSSIDADTAPPKQAKAHPARRGRPPKAQPQARNESTSSEEDEEMPAKVEIPAPAKPRGTRASTRSAAKASQTKTRSHFFKRNSIDDTDEEEDAAEDEDEDASPVRLMRRRRRKVV